MKVEMRITFDVWDGADHAAYEFLAQRLRTGALTLLCADSGERSSYDSAFVPADVISADIEVLDVRMALSEEAKAARRLPHPVLLLQAEHDSPELPVTKTRVVRAVRVPPVREKGKSDDH